jgi:hypothetical protein
VVYSGRWESLSPIRTLRSLHGDKLSEPQNVRLHIVQMFRMRGDLIAPCVIRIWWLNTGTT